MHDQIAFLQIREINVQRGTRGQRMRRFEPARALDFVAAKNFRIGDDDEFRLVTDKAAGERADLRLGSGVWVLGLGCVNVFPQSRDARRQTHFLPDFLKPLPLAVVVAKNVDGVALPQPAVKLLEKFVALRLGNRQFGRAFRQRTKGVERIKLRIADCARLRLALTRQGLRIDSASFNVTQFD